MCLATVGDVDRGTAKKNEANAMLIAAAPDILSALESLTEWGRTYTSPNDPNSPNGLLVVAVEAIAKAKGGAA